MNVAFDFDFTLMFPTEKDSVGEPNVEFVTKLKEHIAAGDNVFIITSRNDTQASRDQIRKFLIKHQIRPLKVFHTNGTPKLSTLLDLNIALFYDDDDKELQHAKSSDIKVVDSFNDDAKKAFQHFYDIDESFKKYVDSLDKI